MKISQTKASLQASESRCRELMENMSDGVAVYKAIETGQNFVFLEHNQAGARITGQEYDQVIG